MDAPAATPLQVQTPQQGHETPQHRDALHARIHGQTATRGRKIPRHCCVFESPPSKAALLFSLTAPHKTFLPASIPAFSVQVLRHQNSTWCSDLPHILQLRAGLVHVPVHSTSSHRRTPQPATLILTHTDTDKSPQGLICRIDMLATPIVGKGADQERRRSGEPSVQSK
jgi:hypothetical protein